MQSVPVTNRMTKDYSTLSSSRLCSWGKRLLTTSLLVTLGVGSYYMYRYYERQQNGQSKPTEK